MVKKKVKKLNLAILGSTGQLGITILKKLSYENFNIIILDRKKYDLSKLSNLEKNLKALKDFDYLINCSAYTQVDKAEIERKKAKKINDDSLKILCNFCYKNKITLIHFSTDYIFSLKSKKKAKEEELALPINYYGLTKLSGEKTIKKSKTNYVILRISWLYSNFRKNFYLTIMKLIKSSKKIKVVNDQLGCPTSAVLVANVVNKLILKQRKRTIKKTFNCCADGFTSWYGFAKMIYKNYCKMNNKKVDEKKILPIKSSQYKTLAKRPRFSLMDNSNIKKYLKYDLLTWKEDLESLMRSVQN